MSLTYDETSTPIAYDLATGEILYYCEKHEGVREAIGNFEPIPNLEKEFENIFIFGASGSGKSYFAANYALAYRRMFPEKNIFMFSQKDSDPSFEVREEGDKKINIKNVLKLRRIKIDDKFLERDIDITKEKCFFDCMIIFDDFMYFDNKKIIEKVCKLIIQILNLGRSRKIFCVITAHLLYQIKNRDMYMNLQNEIHRLVWFKGVNTFQLSYCLKNYWGYTRRQITSLLNFDNTSRFTCISKLPAYVLTQHRCSIK